MLKFLNHFFRVESSIVQTSFKHVEHIEIVSSLSHKKTIQHCYWHIIFLDYFLRHSELVFKVLCKNELFLGGTKTK